MSYDQPLSCYDGPGCALRGQSLWKLRIFERLDGLNEDITLQVILDLKCLDKNGNSYNVIT